MSFWRVIRRFRGRAGAGGIIRVEGLDGLAAIEPRRHEVTKTLHWVQGRGAGAAARSFHTPRQSGRGTRARAATDLWALGNPRRRCARVTRVALPRRAGGADVSGVRVARRWGRVRGPGVVRDSLFRSPAPGRSALVGSVFAGVLPCQGHLAPACGGEAGGLLEAAGEVALVGEAAVFGDAD